MIIGKPDGIIVKIINMGGLYVRIPLAGKVSHSLVVRDNNDNIGFICRGAATHK